MGESLKLDGPWRVALIRNRFSGGTRPADFNPETYARLAFGITGGEKPMRVRLLRLPGRPPKLRLAPNAVARWIRS